MFIRNSWYVVAWSRDLKDRPVAVTLLDEPVVLYRKSDGSVAALEDHCPHRHLPLSMGEPVGDNLQCGYHGMTFDSTGACVRVPSQALIPPNARVKSYAVLEQHGWVWIWMGEREGADPTLVPDFHQLTDPNYAAVGKTNHVECAYQLVTDNLMDLSHVGFVHTTTIGNAAFGEKGELEVRRTSQGVRAKRLVPEVPQPPLYIKSGQLPEGRDIDRWQIIDFIAPCFVFIHLGGAEAGTGALDGRYEHGLNMWVINAMTPVSATRTMYFWASVRRHAIGDPAADALFLAGVGEAFEEDRRVLEAQQRMLSVRNDSWPVVLKSDAASIGARRVLDQMISREHSGKLAPAKAVDEAATV